MSITPPPPPPPLSSTQTLPSFTKSDSIYRKASYLVLDKNEFISAQMTNIVGATVYALMIAYILLYVMSVNVLQCDEMTFRFRSFVCASLTMIIVQLIFIVAVEGNTSYGTHHPVIYAYLVSFVTVHSMFCTFFTFFFLVYLAHPIFVQPFSSRIDGGDGGDDDDDPKTDTTMMLSKILHFWGGEQFQQRIWVIDPAADDDDFGDDNKKRLLSTDELWLRITGQFPVVCAMSIATVITGMRAYGNLMKSW